MRTGWQMPTRRPRNYWKIDRFVSPLDTLMLRNEINRVLKEHCVNRAPLFVQRDTRSISWQSKDFDQIISGQHFPSLKYFRNLIMCVDVGFKIHKIRSEVITNRIQNYLWFNLSLMTLAANEAILIIHSPPGILNQNLHASKVTKSRIKANTYKKIKPHCCIFIFISIPGQIILYSRPRCRCRL